MKQHTDIIETPPEAEVVARGTVARSEHVPAVERVEAPQAGVAQHHAVAYDPYANRRRASYKLVHAIWLVVGVVETLLIMRFVLRALGANAQAGFAEFIYGLTAPLVLPFLNLFGTPAADGSVLELNTLVALVVYGLVGWLIAKVAWLMVGETRAAVSTRSDVVDARSP